MKKNVMLDNETLSLLSDAVIMSIGAVSFDLDTGVIDDPFYVSISIDSNTAQGRRISEDTLLWWMQQSKEAQAVFTEPKVILPEALAMLSDWFGPSDETLVWSNGADFDIPMLAHAFHTNDMNAPWKFFNTRCFRTAKNTNTGIKTVKPINRLPHNALQDAIAQAEHLIKIYAAGNLKLAEAA